MAIQRLLIANRGEIAVRIIRAAKELGITTIQVYSEADKEMLAVNLADESICIGGPHAKDSYLNIENVVGAAIEKAADAVHPGYGFLAESAEFVRAVIDAGKIFVGPSADTIERMGDKVSARQAAAAAGVPIVPGSKGRIDAIDEAAVVAAEIGYPVMIKASAGGGGRGIRIANNEEDLRTMAPQAQSEAAAAFGDGGLYLERSIQSPRHIEVQIVGDGTRAVHFFERECSLQRRRQKVWEEAGAECLDTATREHLCDTAVALAEAVQYRGAGTVEYLYDDASKEFYFIEMNTRIQVEHPVSEMITDTDLVQEMLLVAGGGELSVSQKEIKKTGHAIEVRINAEDPHMQFLPFPGIVTKLKVPRGNGVRFDHFLYEGYQIPPFYDSLIGKLIVHGEDRADAIRKLALALADLEIEGLKTTIPLHLALANDACVQTGAFHTQWLEPWLDAESLTKGAAS
ncbi:MAG: acetyl-CoA carboxylase biotin carboxylase subunit [Gammaproteobacteria bacterium]|nr:MAG: acetyl-CoA carboxylase biotin carboxylase subunit [Gammaproteobacteria bacterium]RLA60583.1 MAG: acetyl-CoA carboxylase biotin carboxylase subunit [Gammaproteobacteria bacterium]